MKALIFVCLMFVGCYHEEKPIGDTDYNEGVGINKVEQPYRFHTAVFTTKDTCLIFENYGEKMYMKIVESNDAIKYDAGVGRNLKITIEFEVVRDEY